MIKQIIIQNQNENNVQKLNFSPQFAPMNQAMFEQDNDYIAYSPKRAGLFKNGNIEN
jgi:hypothetical protein